MTKYIELAWKWLVYSSSNSEKISSTIKGGIGTLLVAISIFYGAGHVDVPMLNGALNGIVDLLVTLVQDLVGLVSVILLIVGTVRKVWSTFKGTNQVVAAFRASQG